MLPAAVPRLPAVMKLKPSALVSPDMVRTFSNGMPSSSATIMAKALREPPVTSTVPKISVAVPSSPTFTVAEVSAPRVNQNPVAMPRPWLGPSFSFIWACALARSSVWI